MSVAFLSLNIDKIDIVFTYSILYIRLMVQNVGCSKMVIYSVKHLSYNFI